MSVDASASTTLTHKSHGPWAAPLGRTARPPSTPGKSGQAEQQADTPRAETPSPFRPHPTFTRSTTPPRTPPGEPRKAIPPLANGTQQHYKPKLDALGGDRPSGAPPDPPPATPPGKRSPHPSQTEDQRDMQRLKKKIRMAINGCSRTKEREKHKHKGRRHPPESRNKGRRHHGLPRPSHHRYA